KFSGLLVIALFIPSMFHNNIFKFPSAKFESPDDYSCWPEILFINPVICDFFAGHIFFDSSFTCSYVCPFPLVNIRFWVVVVFTRTGGASHHLVFIVNDRNFLDVTVLSFPSIRSFSMHLLRS
ncbi:hypothetical protein L9F63_027133, partial [Diploptera punctata]